MKAARIHEFGGTDVLELDEVAVPLPGPGEVLVKVYASSVNPVDQKIASGEAQLKFPVQLPLIIGWDVSGIVEKTGSGVHRFSEGDAVYGRPFPTNDGAFAEYIVVKAEELCKKPRAIDHINAAAVPLAGLTAWQGLFTHGQLQQGQRVLIHGGSGGVGTFAIQFAKWKGAYVITTASADNMAFVKQLGADEAIDYNRERFEDRVGEVDLVLDLIGGETQERSLSVVKQGGKIITTVMPEYQQQAKEKHIQLEGFTALSEAADLEKIAGLIDEGKVRPVIAEIIDLEDVRRAEQISRQGHPRGKIVVKVI